MRCPRCGGYLTQHVHYEEGSTGTFRDWYARCWGCGEWFWRNRLQVIVTAAELIAKHHKRIPCSVIGCRESTSGRALNGFCKRHHHQWLNHLGGHGSIKPPLILLESGRWIESDQVMKRARNGSGRTKPSNPKRPCPICGRVKTMVNRTGPLGGTCDRCKRHNYEEVINGNG